MCVTSAVMDQYNPYIPPSTWKPNTGLPYTVPPTIQPQPIIDPVQLKELLDSFHKALEAAKIFDRLTGQPDCEDPEKAKLEERVAELERRLDAIAEAASNDKSDI